MDVKQAIEGYAAEQTLKHLAKSDRKKINNQRKIIQQERAKILAQIDRHEKHRCEKCIYLGHGGRIQDYRCPCPANTEIRRLGELLENLKNYVESGEYQLKKHNAEAKPTKTNKPIARTSQDAPEQAEEVKSNNESSEPRNKNVVPVEWYVDLKDKYASKLNDAQSELHWKNVEIARLAKYECDYLKLTKDYTDLVTENERLRAMLEKTKDTMQMNIWLMRQHVGFAEQLDEVMG